MSAVHLSIAIMAHPKRADFIPRLQARLDGQATLVLDERSEGCWPTARRAWSAFHPEATHHLVIQDDVMPCLDFVAGAVKALEARHPDDFVSFYANRGVMLEAKAMGVAWAVIGDGVWGQAFCAPTRFVRPFIEWSARHISEEMVADDERWAMFVLAMKSHVWCTAPSLVEHMAPGASLIGYSNRTRVARWFIGENVSALSVDWKKPGAVEGKSGSLGTYVGKYRKFIKEPVTTYISDAP